MSGRPSGERPDPPAGATAAQGALIELAEAAGAGAGLAEVLERVARAAGTLVPGSLVHVWLAGDDPRELGLGAEVGARPDEAGRAFRRTAPMGEGLLGTVVGSTEPVVVPSFPGDDRLFSPAWTRHQGVCSLAGVRLARGDRPLGALCLLTRRPHVFTPLEVDFLRSFGAHAAVAIEGAALLELASRRLRRLETLREIEAEISGQRDPHALMATISRRAAELLDADTGAVYLLDEAGQVLRPHAAFNRPEWMQGVAIPMGEGAIGATAARGQGMVVNDYPGSPLALPRFRDVHRAVVTQPLVAGRALRGVIAVTRDVAARQFTPADLGILGDFAVQASIALENARLLRLASARAERVKAAAQVGQLLASSRDADRILDLIAEKCREILGAQAFGLFRFDRGRLRYARGFGLDERFQAEHTLALGEGVVGKAARDRRTVETRDILGDPDVELSPEARARIESQGSRAIAAVPLLATDRVLGALAVYHPVGFRIPAEDGEFLETLAAHAAVALENARLFAESRRRQETAEALAAITQTLTASLDLRTVLSRVADAVRELFGADGGAIGLVTAGGAMRLAARRGLGADTLRSLVLAPGQGVTGWVLRHQQPFRTADYARDSRITQTFVPEIAQAGIHGTLAVPVRLQDEVVGILYGFWSQPVELTDEHVSLATDLARVVAVAVANARLYEEARAHELEARGALAELRRTQEQLVRMEKLRALGEMASGVAHDFNNVLAVILGRVQLLRRKLRDPTFLRWLEVIEQAALDGARTVRQIQEFTRVRRDEPTQTVDVNQAVRDAVELTRARWRDDPQSRGVEIRLGLELGAVPPVDGQPLELREVLTSLIQNAVEALPRGGEIRIATRPREDAVEVSVADTGVGMSDSVRRRIFEPFFSTKGPNGTGLGLAMVHGIVSRHRGEILVDTAEGAGSTFTVRLPVGRPPGVPAAPPSGTGPGAVRVLVIDDEPFVRDTLEEILRQQHHDVVVAGDGVSGLARFREGAFDLVMTDLAMPGMSGWQVAQAVKAARPQVPVVLVTGWGVDVQGDDLRTRGVDRVMTKPFRFEDVQDVVARFRGTGGPTREKGRVP